jgi:uncharacterized membrane protein YedE/YeeE
MDWIFGTWPWYVAGPMITLVMVLLLMLEKEFGISNNLRTMCTITGADKAADFFKFDWKAQKWNLLIALGAAMGGYIASHFLSPNNVVIIEESVVANLQDLGFESVNNAYIPTELYSIEALTDIKSVAVIFIGGLLVGFGSRYAGGCTSGHAISGLSNLQLPSLITVIGFFTGGLITIHILFPLIF